MKEKSYNFDDFIAKESDTDKFNDDSSSTSRHSYDYIHKHEFEKDE